MIDLQSVASELGTSDTRNLSPELWTWSMSTLPSGHLQFLSESFIAQACEYSQLTPDMQSNLISAAHRLESSPAARALLWHAHSLLADEKGAIHHWPDPIPALGPDSGAFYLLATLSLTNIARQIHQRLGIPQKIVRETMGDILLHIEKYRARRAAFGIAAYEAGDWFPGHFHGHLFRLGRLNFIPMPWTNPIQGYEWTAQSTPHDLDGNPLPHTILMAGDNTQFRRDGQINGAAGITESTGTWTSTLRQDNHQITANPIDSNTASARPDPIRLATSDWKPILSKGSPLIDIHIPEIGPLDFHQCGDALAQAKEFFPKYFPAAPHPIAFHCHCWMLDPQLEKYLPPTSNIIRFAQEFYRFPTNSGTSGIHKNLNPTRLSSLERAIKEHTNSGGHWRNTGGIIFMNDFAWGNQAYSKQSE